MGGVGCGDRPSARLHTHSLTVEFSGAWDDRVQSSCLSTFEVPLDCSCGNGIRHRESALPLPRYLHSLPPAG